MVLKDTEASVLESARPESKPNVYMYSASNGRGCHTSWPGGISSRTIDLTSGIPAATAAGIDLLCHSTQRHIIMPKDASSGIPAFLRALALCIPVIACAPALQILSATELLLALW